jgi:hypothetical protein
VVVALMIRRQEGLGLFYEFFGRIKRKNKEPGMVVHTCNPSTQKAKAGGS